MLRGTHLILALFLTVLWVAPTRADWQTLLESASEALKAKNYDLAEELALEALEETEDEKDTARSRIATFLMLSRTYQESRQWAASANLLHRTLKAYEELGEAETDAASRLWNTMAVSYHQMKEFDKAEEAYRKALDIKKLNYKENLSSIALVITNLGELYRRLNAWDKGEALQREAIADKKRELGEDSPSLVASYNNLALVLRKVHKYEDAKQNLENALKISEKIDGGKNEDFATSLSTYGSVLADLKDYENSEKYLQRAFLLRKKLLDKDHPSIAETLGNLANTYSILGKKQDALAAYDESIRIYKQEYGQSDSRTLHSMTNKAIAFERFKDHEAAQELRDEIKAIKKR